MIKKALKNTIKAFLTIMLVMLFFLLLIITYNKSTIENNLHNYETYKVINANQHTVELRWKRILLSDTTIYYTADDSR